MIIDKKEHKEILLQMINTTNFPGNTLEIALELKNAIIEADIKNNGIDDKNNKDQMI